MLAKLRDIWWWMLHRTTHRFNRVKIKSLKPGYYDIDYRMLHACFQLLVDYVENERPFEIIDWDHDDESRQIAQEIKELYYWWKNEYPMRREPIHDIDESLVPPLTVVCRGDLTEYPAWEEACKKTQELEERWDREDDENLIRLMKIRPYLWT